jgi:hypothetical protein
MIVYHVTKTRESLMKILISGMLLPGRNVSDRSTNYVHLSKTPFIQGSWALDVIGPDTNEAWILTCIIHDDVPLLPDPSGEGGLYEGEWVVHNGPLSIDLVSMKHIPNVRRFENGETQSKYS